MQTENHIKIYCATVRCERAARQNRIECAYISLFGWAPHAHQQTKLQTINFLTGCNYLILEIKSRYETTKSC